MVTNRSRDGQTVTRETIIAPKVLKQLRTNKQVASYTIAETARQYRSHMLRNLG